VITGLRTSLSFKQEARQVANQQIIQMPKLELRQNVVQMPRVMQMGRLEQSPRLFNMQMPQSALRTEQMPRLMNMQIPVQITKQTSTPRFSNPFPTSPGFPEMPKTFIPVMPSLPQMGWTESFGKGGRAKIKTRYTPSLGAVLTGFKVPKMSKGIKFRELTGILGRPIITGGRSSSSRKKKK
jgi:hypothetical protein